MTPERLQKILARTGVGSRRQIEELIREGRITINGRVAELGDRADLGADAVKVDGRRILPSQKPRQYILLNKPGGYVSTIDDPEGRATVLDLLPTRLHRGLVPVGRLDYATEGLLLLTDDGDFAQHIAHPRYGCTKTYEVKVKGHPSEAMIDKLRRGIVIEGKRTAPADIRPLKGHLGARNSVENSWWRVILSEGRTRQIRDMFGRIGHLVSRLRRVAIGPLADPGLPRGAWRELTEGEVEMLRKRTARTRPRPSLPKSPAKGSPAKAAPAKETKTREKKTLEKKGREKKASPSSSKGPSPRGRSKTGPSRDSRGKGKGRARSGPSSKRKRP